MFKHLIYLPLVLLLPAPAFAASSVDYDYIDGAVVNLDGPGDDYTGFGLRGAWPVAEQLYISAEASSTTADDGIDIDRLDVGFGAGYHMPLNRSTDLFGQIDFLRVDTDGADDDGLRVMAGVRSLVADDLELRGSIQYVDVFDGELVANLGAQYWLSPGWAGFVELSEGDGFGGYMLGVRFDY